MKKRIIAGALAGIVCITLFSGCGNKTETQAGKEVKTKEIKIAESSEVSESDINEKSSNDEGDVIHLDFSDSNFGENINSDDSEDIKKEVSSEGVTEAVTEESKSDETIEEQVIFDQGGLRITAKGLEKSGWNGPCLNVLIENESDEDVLIMAKSLSINGYMVSVKDSPYVLKGQKTYSAITFSDKEMEKLGISSIADIEFNLNVLNPSTYLEIFDPSLVRIKTSLADSYDYEFDDTGKVAFDEDGVKIVIKGLGEEDSAIFGKEFIKVYIENTTEKNLTTQLRNTTINGIKIDPTFSTEVTPGKHSISAIYFLSTDLYDNNINEIKEAEFRFHIYETNNLFSDNIIESKMIKITF